MGRETTQENNFVNMVLRLNLTSDIFASKVFEKEDVLKELIESLTGENIIIKEVRIQHSIRQLVGHSVILDVYAEQQDGRLIHIEIQNRDDDDHAKRNRYCRSCIDSSLLDKGTKYQELPDMLQIFISRSDFSRSGKSLIWNTKPISDGTKELYFNLSEHDGEDEKIQALQRYFLNTSKENESSYFPKLVSRVRFFKNEKKGMSEMCEVMDKIRETGVVKGIQTSIYDLLWQWEIPDSLYEVIDNEMDIETLRQWHRKAAVARSLDEFVNLIQ